MQIYTDWIRFIIPYQEIIGNYSETISVLLEYPIIPYQEIIGNYSLCEFK